MGSISASPIASPWWLSNPHLKTRWPSHPRPRRQQVRERVELGDDDFIDLSCVKGTQGPFVLVLHSLEVSLDSDYGGDLGGQRLLAPFHALAGSHRYAEPASPWATTRGHRKT
jgi:predicted alpha/beta-fold hydrolase